MIISPALAQGGGAAPGGLGGIGGLLPFILIAVVFYFLLIRPQQKRQKQHKEMIANLRRGDRVITAGGIIGTVTRVISDREVQVEIAPDVKIRVSRPTISEVVAKTEPAAEREEKEAESRDERDEETGKSGRGKGKSLLARRKKSDKSD